MMTWQMILTRDIGDFQGMLVYDPKYVEFCDDIEKRRLESDDKEAGFTPSPPGENAAQVLILFR